MHIDLHTHSCVAWMTTIINNLLIHTIDQKKEINTLSTFYNNLLHNLIET